MSLETSFVFVFVTELEDGDEEELVDEVLDVTVVETDEELLSEIGLVGELEELLLEVELLLDDVVMDDSVGNDKGTEDADTTVYFDDLP